MGVAIFSREIVQNVLNHFMGYILKLEFAPFATQESCVKLHFTHHSLAKGLNLACEFGLLPFIHQFVNGWF